MLQKSDAVEGPCRERLTRARQPLDTTSGIRNPLTLETRSSILTDGQRAAFKPLIEMCRLSVKVASHNLRQTRSTIVWLHQNGTDGDSVGDGSVCAAVILDAWSRRVIGYAISRSIDARLAIAVIDTAIQARGRNAGCIHHSDRGSQYVSINYRKLLDDHQIQEPTRQSL